MDQWTLTRYLSEIAAHRLNGGIVKDMAISALRRFSSLRAQLAILDAVYCAGLTAGRQAVVGLRRRPVEAGQ